jgi:hypothetical protein
MTSNSTASRCQPHRLTRFLILIDARHATHSSVNQQTLASVNQHRHHQPHRDILNLFVARLRIDSGFMLPNRGRCLM